MKNLSLRELVGQRIVVGFPGTEIDSELEDLICNYKVGNIILFKHNITSNKQLKKLCQDLHHMIKEETGFNPFITIDQEGGMVTRLDRDGVNMPGAMAIAATDEVNNAYEAGRITGLQLGDLDINFNLAPTVDVNSNIDNPVIGVRSFGDDPKKVGEYAVAMAKGLELGGVLSCAKHFPGHGDTNVDSHLGLPLVNKTLEELQKCELVPYEKLIEAGIPAIMTTHILFPELEKEKIPATMSRKIITELLREKMGFQGLVLSDCMEMNAIKEYYGTIEGAVKAIMAGVDLIFISHTTEVAKGLSDTLVKALEDHVLSIEEMEESIERILKYKEMIISSKKEVGNSFDIKRGKEFAYNLLKDSITPVQMPTKDLPELGDSPLFVGVPLFRATNVSNQQEKDINFVSYLAERFDGKGELLSPNPTEVEIHSALEGVENYSCVVIGTYNGHLYKGQIKLIEEAAKRHERVIVFALRNPYDLKDLDESVYSITVYEYTDASLEAIGDLLEHQFLPSGILPVKM